MVNTQEWLESQEQYNTKEKREKIIELNIGLKGLFGELDLSDFINLEKLNCMGNWLTKLTFPINPVNLKELHLSGNILTGSLDFLSNMKSLKVLSIGDNDFNEVNLDNLPRSLECIDYYANRKNCKLIEIISKLEEVKYGFCQKCQQPNNSKKWCQPCIKKEWEQDLKKLPGQEIIKKLAQKLGKDAWGNYKFEWIPYELFTNIEYLAEGGFGKVYRAKWKVRFLHHNPYNDIVLKSLHNSQNISLEFLTELANTILINNCNIAIYTVKCWGVSRDPITRNYVMVMDHIKGGNFREYLQQNSKKLDLGIKLKKLFNIAIGLNFVHEQNLVHKDLHAGNILNDKYGDGDGDGYDRSFVSDFGLSHPVNFPKKEGRIFGVPAYISPEVLQGHSYTQASDVYSFGIVAYELLASSYPYYEKKDLSDEELITKICLGLRPNIDELKIPQLLKDLIKKCWDANPQKRPNTRELYEILSAWRSEVYNEKDTSFYQQHQVLEEEYNNLSKNTIYRIHPAATVISIPINTKEITQLLQLHQQNPQELVKIIHDLQTENKKLKKQLHEYADYNQSIILNNFEQKYQQLKNTINSLLQEEENLRTKEIDTLQTQPIITADILTKIKEQKNNLSNLQKTNQELEKRIDYCERLEKELIQKTTELEAIQERGRTDLSKLTTEEIGKLCQLPGEIKELEKQLFETRKLLKEKGITININGSISVNKGHVLIGSSFGNNTNLNYQIEQVLESKTEILPK